MKKNNRFDLDSYDLKILRILQSDSDTTLQVMGETVGLSPSACSRRIGALRASGAIRKNIAIIDRELTHSNVIAFVLIRAASHTTVDIEKFRKSLNGIVEIAEAHRLTGNYDFMLKINISSVDHYDQIYKTIINRVDLDRVSSYFSAEVISDQTKIL
ncbi:Lrp/AsnC family transcriptional regulator [Gluconobacter thailandicus]|nr:Lrp/AsnC family transcriptional regulator [Gluconobacter thailandicus]